MSLGDTAVVTGASAGIGRAVAQRLAGEGMYVFLGARNVGLLRQLRSSIESSGGRACEAELDLRDEASVDQFADAITARTERVNVLVHCGGIHHQGAWSSTTSDEIDAVLETNVRGVYLLTQRLLDGLVAATGDVVFVNSTIIYSDGRNAGLYAAGQHAVLGLAESLRAEVNDRGVRVLSVYPGRTATPRQEQIFAFEGKPYVPERLLQPEDVAQAIIACLRLPGTAEVTDLRIRPRHKH